MRLLSLTLMKYYSANQTNKGLTENTEIRKIQELLKCGESDIRHYNTESHRFRNESILVFFGCWLSSCLRTTLSRSNNVSSFHKRAHNTVHYLDVFAHL